MHCPMADVHILRFIENVKILIKDFLPSGKIAKALSAKEHAMFSACVHRRPIVYFLLPITCV